MGLFFHRTLTLSCPHCSAKLIRIAPSEYLDLAVCPACLAAGLYDDVVEDGGEVTPGWALPPDMAEYVRTLGRGSTQ